MNYQVQIFPIGQAPSILDRFYRKLPKSARRKIVRQLLYLEEYGLDSSVSDLRKLRGYDIWEVRILGKENIRILVFGIENQIFVLHIFAKKKQDTETKHLKTAQNRQKLIINMLTNDI